MTTHKEALKMALEALEWFTTAEQGDEPPINKTIIAIKEALNREAMASSPNGKAQPEQEPLTYKKARIHWLCQEWKEDHLSDINFVEAIIAECITPPQPKEPEQEPVPDLYVKDINGNFHSYKEKGHT